MGINKAKLSKKPELDPKRVKSRECKAQAATMTFSFKHISEHKEFSFCYFEKANAESVNAAIQLMNQLSSMSQLTYDDMLNHGRKGGIEHIPITQMKEKFINSIGLKMSDDEKLGVMRFNGQNYRMFIKRGTKCPRVVHVLGFEFKLGSVYKHS